MVFLGFFIFFYYFSMSYLKEDVRVCVCARKCVYVRIYVCIYKGKDWRIVKIRLGFVGSDVFLIIIEGYFRGIRCLGI